MDKTFVEVLSGMFVGIDLIAASKRFSELGNNKDRLVDEYVVDYPKKQVSLPLLSPRVIPDEVLSLAQMFEKLDLNRATTRYNELGRNQARLIDEYLVDYPRKEDPTANSPPVLQTANFTGIDEAVPHRYKSFALVFLLNEFPKLNVNYIRSKLEGEYKGHLYPTFHFIMKKYCLCDCLRHPKDEDADEIYNLKNEVKDNYGPATSRPPFGKEQEICVQLYPKLRAELELIAQERESIMVEAINIKGLLNERRRLIEDYARRGGAAASSSSTSKPDEGYPLSECPICVLHYLEAEICQCLQNNHRLCRYCLSKIVVDNYLSRCLSNVHCLECDSPYAREGLSKALGPIQFQQYLETMAFNDLRPLTAEPDTYCCLYCPFRITLPRKPDLFECRNPECRRVQCLVCSREASSHPGGVCPVKQRTREAMEANLRVFVLRRMDEAVLCLCPQCKQPIQKDGGCNHITCVCGCSFCYLCHELCEKVAMPNHFKRGKCEQFGPQGPVDKAAREKAKVDAVAEWRRLHPNAPTDIRLVV